jgi:hypothetical protein
MSFKALFAAAALGAAILGAGASQAQTTVALNLYNTGVDAFGAPLADGALDPHYVLNGSGLATVYTHPAYLTDPNAKFISAQADGGYSANPNTFSLFFSLVGLNASTAQLSGFFGSDNYASVFLNGNLIAQDIQATVYENFQSLTAFSSGAANFVAGLNELRFVVTDTGPPSAVIVTGLTGTADTNAVPAGVPEPATWALMIMGFGAAGAMVRRRKAALA